MVSKRLIEVVLFTIAMFWLDIVYSQCIDCSIVVADNSVSSYTVTTGQKLCIAENFTYTGNLTLNGGAICNSGTITKLEIRYGVFENSIYGKVTALSNGDIVFKVSGETIINNYTGSQMIFNDSLSIYNNSSDSLIVNIHKGSSTSCQNFNIFSGSSRFNIGLAATSTTNSDFITSLNVNGNVIFNSNASVFVSELASFNINGTFTLKDDGLKTLDNYGVVNVNDSVNISGDAQGSGTITINNYSELSLFNGINCTILNASVRLNNNAISSSAIMYIEGDVNLYGIDTELNNSNFLQVNGVINNVNSVFNNDMYVEASILRITSGVVTNNSEMNLYSDFQIDEPVGVFNNNSIVFLNGNLGNYGVINLGKASVIVTGDFENKYSSVPGVINGPLDILNEESLPDTINYARIFVNGNSKNEGQLNNYLLLADLTPPGSNPRIDDIGENSSLGDDVFFEHLCDLVLGVGYITSSSNVDEVGPRGPRSRTDFCPGENLTLTLNSFVPILSGPYWSYGISAGWIPISTGMSVPIFGLISGGNVTASGTYFNGITECYFSVVFSINVSTASISATSPLHFGVGNNVLLTSTVTSGTAPFQFTWTPNYSFVFPTTNSFKDPIVSPQVSLIYTVSMRDVYGCAASNTVEVIGEPFARLDKELNNEYYKLFSDQLFFKNEAQYDASNLSYYVYDKTHTVVASSNNNNLVNLQVISPGDNRLTLNASSLPTGYYTLEVTNEKTEKLYLRFKK
ncbi:hypothetical protein [Aurantibacillus circumpalustris]|uniref:hypothetical protein n=1 Tax=Aurantibacillus circumpalustris TaxID=3036359 RepID=UPI00295A8A9A|nr:hypothetical protein [Aurantibacillus circumpalustris]